MSHSPSRSVAMRRKLAWVAAGLAVLVLASSAWAPPPRRRITTTHTTTHSTNNHVVEAGKALSRTWVLRTENPLAAAKVLRELGVVVLSEKEHAEALNEIVSRVLRQRQPHHSERLAAVRQLSADWNSVGSGGGGSDPLTAMELATAEAAAEKQILLAVLGLVKELRYQQAWAEIKPILQPRYLSLPVSRAVLDLGVVLMQLDWLLGFNPDHPVALPGQTATMKRMGPAVAAIRAVRGVESELSPTAGRDVREIDARLAALGEAFSAADAARVRVEVSVALFLSGRVAVAAELLKGEVPAEETRVLLDDLRSVVLGAGAVENAAVANAIRADGLPKVIEPLIPVADRGKWRAPELPKAVESTLERLGKRARREAAMISAEEQAKLAARAAAVVADIEAELTKQTGGLNPFRERAEARLGRPLNGVEEQEFIAAAAFRGFAAEDAAALLSAQEKRSPRGVRLLGVALSSGHLALAAVAGATPGDALRLSPEVRACERSRIRLAVEAAMRNDPPPDDRKAFEAAVAKDLGLADVRELRRPEVIMGLLDVTEAAAAAHKTLAADLNHLRIEARDVEDKESIDRIGAREAALTGAAGQRSRQVVAACRLFTECGRDALPALAWLRTTQGAPCPWVDEAAAALERLELHMTK